MKYEKGDLLSVTKGVIVHGCNAQGVMGSGVAVQIKQKYPEAYIKYLDDYLEGFLTLGVLSVTRVTKDLTIVSAITQNSYGRDPKIRYADYAAIETAFGQIYETWPNTPVYAPRIGAGLGNGDWNIISKLIDNPNLTIMDL